MKQTIFHFLRIIAAAAVGALVTAALSTALTFLASNPAAFGISTAIVAAAIHAADDEWTDDEPEGESTISGTPTTPQQ